MSPSFSSRCTKKSLSGGTGHQMEPMVLPTSLPKTLYFLPVVWKAELDSVFLCWAGPPSSTTAEAEVRDSTWLPGGADARATSAQPNVVRSSWPSWLCPCPGRTVLGRCSTDPTACPCAGTQLDLGSCWDNLAPAVGGEPKEEPAFQQQENLGEPPPKLYSCKARNKPANTEQLSQVKNEFSNVYSLHCYV